MEEPKIPAKTPMTDEERLQLAKKLDKELDDFIEGLEKKRYTEGWPEDRWEEEMAKHPFFMKSTPDGGELSPLAQGLANLKYDPDENTNVQLAENYKEDGNFNFKHKNYRLAILSYTEGIKVKCEDPILEASLYNNRSAAHYHLKNYRSSLSDAEKALKHNPDHKKALIRAANCCNNIKNYEKCMEYCEKILKADPNNQEIITLMQNSKQNFQIKKRDERKREKIDKTYEIERDRILNAVKKRGIKISNLEEGEDLDLSQLEPCIPGTEGARVYLENDVLVWPVLILYPEFCTTDCIKNCPENVPLISQLEQLFPAPWDEKKSYKISDINVYFEGWDNKVHKVDFNKKLSDILVQSYFELRVGTPAFLVIVRNSAAEKQFLKKY